MISWCFILSRVKEWGQTDCYFRYLIYYNILICCLEIRIIIHPYCPLNHSGASSIWSIYNSHYLQQSYSHCDDIFHFLHAHFPLCQHDFLSCMHDSFSIRWQHTANCFLLSNLSSWRVSQGWKLSIFTFMSLRLSLTFVARSGELNFLVNKL